MRNDALRDAIAEIVDPKPFERLLFHKREIDTDPRRRKIAENKADRIMLMIKGWRHTTAEALSKNAPPLDFTGK